MVYPPQNIWGDLNLKNAGIAGGLKFKIHFRGDLDIWGDHLQLTKCGGSIVRD